MSDCSHECGSCSQSCSDRKEPESLIKKTNEFSHVKKVIGIVSGKGGVGKSLVTSMMAVLSQRNGYKTAIMDADITGPSIPKAFGITKKAGANEYGILPCVTATGIKVISVNLLLENDTDPVVWRGPILAGTVNQFWTEVIWEDVDYMYVDMPPGTSDIPLTIYQSIPVNGIIIVTSPQDLVSMVVQKAVTMAEMMHIPILGIVENMSFVKCPDCNKEIKLFGESHIDDIANKHNLKVLGRLPIDPKLAAACDKGAIELFEGNWLDKASDAVQNI